MTGEQIPGLWSTERNVPDGTKVFLAPCRQPRNRIPLEARPSLVLSAESELGITAGLQDRVIQVWCACCGLEKQRISINARMDRAYGTHFDAVRTGLWWHGLHGL